MARRDRGTILHGRLAKLLRLGFQARLKQSEVASLSTMKNAASPSPHSSRYYRNSQWGHGLIVELLLNGMNDVMFYVILAG